MPWIHYWQTGEEYSTNVYKGRHCPEVQSITLLYTIFERKGTPFVCLHIPNLEFCITLTCCKCTVFKI